MRFVKIIFIISLIVTCSSGIAMAHDGYDTVHGEGNKADEAEWSPLSAGPIITWTAPLCGKAKFVIQPFFFYNYTRGTFNSSDHYSSLPGGDNKYQFQEQLFAQLGLTELLEIDAQTVYQQNYAKQNGTKAHSSGFGDSYLYARYCVFEEKSLIPNVAALGQLKMPTGKYQHANPDELGTDLMGASTGGGSWDPGFGIIVTKKLKPFVLHADAIYSFPLQARVDGIKTRYGNYFNCDIGAEYFLPKGFNLMFETNLLLQADRRSGGRKISDSCVNSFTIAPGIGWSNEKIQTLLAYQRVMAGTNTDANDSVVCTFVYTF